LLLCGVAEVVAVRVLPVSLLAIAAFAAAPVLAPAQNVPVGPGKVVTGPPGLPSVEPLSSGASNINGADTRSVIAPALPSADLGPNATAVDYLQAAQSALAANRTGRAQSALENAETLLLTRSVPLDTTAYADQNPAISNISAALRVLANRDIQDAMNLVRQAIRMAAQVPPPPPPG
jgi:hypothetical protein